MRRAQELGDVFGRVDVEHEAGKAQDIGGRPFDERLIQMRAKTARAKAALDAIGRRAHQRIGAGAIGGGNNDQGRAASPRPPAA